MTGSIVGEVDALRITPRTPHSQLISLASDLPRWLSLLPVWTFASAPSGLKLCPQIMTITNNASTSPTFFYVVSGNFTAVPGGSTPCSANQPVTLNAGLVAR